MSMVCSFELGSINFEFGSLNELGIINFELIKGFDDVIALA